MSNFEKVILKKVFFENLEITFWDSIKEKHRLKRKVVTIFKCLEQKNVKIIMSGFGYVIARVF